MTLCAPPICSLTPRVVHRLWRRSPCGCPHRSCRPVCFKLKTIFKIGMVSAQFSKPLRCVWFLWRNTSVFPGSQYGRSTQFRNSSTPAQQPIASTGRYLRPPCKHTRNMHLLEDTGPHKAEAHRLDGWCYPWTSSTHLESLVRYENSANYSFLGSAHGAEPCTLMHTIW